MTADTSKAVAASQPKFGRYRLLERLGVHRNAEAFYALEACEDGSARPVILRRLLLSASEDRKQRERFESIIEVASRVHHPRLLRVLDAGQEEGQPYVVSAAVQGLDLGRTLHFLRARRSTLSTEVALHIGEEALTSVIALREGSSRPPHPCPAHGRIAPAMFILGLHGEIWLDHVGLLTAMPVGEHASGSELAYVAPEQIEGAVPDARADVFAMAVILSEMLAGRPLFRGDTDLAVLFSIRDTDTSSSASDLPCSTTLRELLANALARRPAQRPASLEAFLDALRAQRSDAPSDVENAVAATVAEARRATQLEPGTSQSAPSPLRPAPAPDAYGSAADHLAEYQARTSKGELLGPWRFFRVVEAVATGELRADDRISVAGGAFREVARLPQLARYLPSSARAPLQPVEPLVTYAFPHGGLLRALVDAYLERREGLLLCEYGSLRKEVFLSEGLPQSITSNLASDLLGEQLVRHHVISRSELDMALVVMPRYGGRLGDTVVALGLVDPLHLATFIVEQVRERLLELFTWSNGAAMFYDHIKPPEQTVPLGWELWPLLEEGMRRRFATGLENGAWPEQARLDPLQPRAGALAATEGAPPGLRRLLRAPAGSHTVAEACKMLGDPNGNDSEQARLLLALSKHVGALRCSAS